jgi:hypothetical protein
LGSWQLIFGTQTEPKKPIIAKAMGAIVNFFGIEISDERFEAAMTAARAGIFPRVLVNIDGMTLRNALGFGTGDVGEAAPPASEINRVS